CERSEREVVGDAGHVARRSFVLEHHRPSHPAVAARRPPSPRYRGGEGVGQQIAGTAMSGEVLRIRRWPRALPSGSSGATAAAAKPPPTAAVNVCATWSGPGKTSTQRTLRGELAGSPSSASTLTICEAAK